MNRWLIVASGAACLAMCGPVAAVCWAADAPKLPPMIPPSALEPEAPAAPPPPATTSAEAEEAVFLAKLKEVRLIEIKHLRSTDAGEFEKGRRLILDLPEDTYAGPMVSVLYGPNARYRSLLLDALKEFAGRGSKVAQAYLQEVAVGDAAAPNRRRAIDTLKAASAAPPTDRLIYHLAVDDVAALRDRAATALAALADKRAAWLMVDRLTTEEWRAVTAEVPVAVSSAINVTNVGVPKFRQATVQGAVAGGPVISQTIDLPTVDVFEVSTPVFGGPTVTTVIGQHRVQVQHPEMLAALRTLTGKDFGYDKDAWTKWMQSADGAKAIPPWKPLKLVAD